MTGAGTQVQAKRKTKVGRVVSDKMDKTIVVSVERLARHRLYKRVIRLTTKFKAHDDANEAHVGDTVLIEESRPLSATKRWRLVSVIQRAGDHGLPGEPVVIEEEETSEAIHAAAHPGRRQAAEAAEAPRPRPRPRRLRSPRRQQSPRRPPEVEATAEAVEVAAESEATDEPEGGDR